MNAVRVVVASVALLLEVGCGSKEVVAANDSTDSVAYINVKPTVSTARPGERFPLTYVAIDRFGHELGSVNGVIPASSNTNVAYIRSDTLFAERAGEATLTVSGVFSGRAIAGKWGLIVMAVPVGQ